ncbi:MAG: insulinase family protein, partial [Phycisphaerae bacterium]|nr:insulinase family protein [Phycisphaerae bacterium]
MNCTHTLFGAAIACAAVLAPIALADDLPSRPEQLVFKPLDFKAPKAVDYRRTLANGVVVYMAPSKELPLINLSLSFRGGAYMDPADIPGLTSAMASLMRTGGTTTVKPDELDEKFDFLATNAGVSAGGETVTASMNCLASNLDQSLAMFFDMLRNPGFDQARLDVMKGQAIEGMKQRNDDAGSILGREWSTLIYGDNHFESRQPTQASWSKVTVDEIAAQHKRLIHPGNVIISVTGDFNPKEMMSKLESAMEGWQKGDRAPNPPAPIDTLTPGVYHVGKDIPQGKVRVGRRSIMRDDPDYFAAEVMNDILGGGGFTSRLMKSIRSNEGLAYGVGSRFGAGTYYPGVFAVGFESKSPTVALALQLMRDEFKRMSDGPVSSEELEVAKRSFVESFPQTFSSRDAMLGIFVSDEWTGRDPNFWQTYRDNVNKVSAEDVQRVAKKYLNLDDMVILVVGKWNDIAKGDLTG